MSFLDQLRALPEVGERIGRATAGNHNHATGIGESRRQILREGIQVLDGCVPVQHQHVRQLQGGFRDVTLSVLAEPSYWQIQGLVGDHVLGHIEYCSAGWLRGSKPVHEEFPPSHWRYTERLPHRTAGHAALKIFARKSQSRRKRQDRSRLEK